MNKLIVFLLSIFMISNNNQLFSAASSQQLAIEQAQNPEKELMRYLGVYDLGINEKSSDGYTKLMCAVMYNKISWMCELLKAGADEYIINPNNGDTFFTLIQCVDQKVRDAYNELQSEPTKQLWSILKKNISEENKVTNDPIDIQAVKKALEAGANSNSVLLCNDFEFSFIFTPLYIAVSTNNLELTKLFVENSKNIDLIDGKNATPLIIAAKNKNLDIVTLLLRAGADVNNISYDDNLNPENFISIINQKGFEEVRKAYDEFLKFMQDKKAKLMELIPTLPSDLASIINQYEHFEIPIVKSIVENRKMNSFTQDINHSDDVD